VTDTNGYNERIFSRGIRARLHLARFAWLQNICAELISDKPLRVVELGCFDGRSIEWLPAKPAWYDGFDANWEGGLDIGRERYRGDETIHFYSCSSPSVMTVDDREYDLGICLETMEHVPPAMVEGYLEKFAISVKGAVLFTVPNEIGLPFVGKSLAKNLIYRDSKDEAYTFGEYWNEVFGNTMDVHRNEHKGFDYRQFVKQVERHFDVKRVTGIPFTWLAPALSFTIGIVAVPKVN
jgi:2-polyprenyl-3-methyl-5-hydroxy-6-metoxy-1,4-benzoquinol methylase